VTKPVLFRELVSRRRAVVRRARGLVGPSLKLIQVGAIAIDPASMTVTVSGKNVTLTGYEFALLKALADRAGAVARHAAATAFVRSLFEDWEHDGH
jgi:DNA-binding response OmpR family regulator